jgi:hypothetical protein
MGMTIEDCISKLNEILEEATEDENSVCYVTDIDEPTLKMAIDIMHKYQQLQTNYEKRLKADLKAILVELLLEIEEKFNDRPFSYNHHQRTEFYRDIDEVIQQKINSLKEA